MWIRRRKNLKKVIELSMFGFVDVPGLPGFGHEAILRSLCVCRTLFFRPCKCKSKWNWRCIQDLEIPNVAYDLTTVDHDVHMYVQHDCTALGVG